MQVLCGRLQVSVQAFNNEYPQGRRTLGLFLHRRKAEATDSLKNVHMYIDSREKVTARYQLICPSKREVMVFGNFKDSGTLLPKAPKGWGWRTALLFDELPDLLQAAASIALAVGALAVGVVVAMAAATASTPVAATFANFLLLLSAAMDSSLRGRRILSSSRPEVFLLDIYFWKLILRLSTNGDHLSISLKLPEPKASEKLVVVDRWLSSVDRWLSSIDRWTRLVDNQTRPVDSMEMNAQERLVAAMETLRQDVELYAQAQREAHVQINEEVLNLTAGAFLEGNPRASLDTMTQIMNNLDSLKMGKDMLLHQVEGY
ncbi:hypothetical protein Taro_040626 [Colocasia esculenta]|uniref:Uncharacterized protein n=1 Tax=Colocasia esculenta TaxID=4460 RepID=A0A843WMF3_COLES|nr:hypothetical protein [Colocasia esculenta]